MSSCNIVVRGFDYATSEQEVLAHCSTAGTATTVSMIDGGSAVVTFTTPADAMFAVGALNCSTIPGNRRFVEVKLDENSTERCSSNAGTKRPAPSSAGPGGNWVIVRGFDFGTTEDQLYSHCSQAGAVREITWCDKGSVSVSFGSPQEAAAAVAWLNKTTIAGNRRFIDVLRKNEAEDASPMMFKNMALMQNVMGKGGGKGMAMSREDNVGSGRVFVHGYDFGTTEEQLHWHMAQAGDIVAVQPETQGSASVVYRTAAMADRAAMQLNRTTIMGNRRFIDVLK